MHFAVSFHTEILGSGIAILDMNDVVGYSQGSNNLQHHRVKILSLAAGLSI